MHFNVLATAATAALTFGPASAVTIFNYRTGTCNGNSYKQCSDIGKFQCCDGSLIDKQVKSAKFIDLQMTSFGVICDGTDKVPCGPKVQSTMGLGSCIGAESGRGTMWGDCNYCRKRGVDGRDVLDIDQALKVASESQAFGVVAADVAGFLDKNKKPHQFNINGTVPEDVKEQFEHYIDADSLYEDLPENLKAYELKGNHRRGIMEYVD
ncbi:hypothetical protein F4820DRAFT_470647 [Hypoxylon rubiginosum]|uniref:Uncharacterized protein n=1 Tax=Hypoxylon rubiginosum TaxID=110542 RepID=A0ACB9YXZ7_9PEZI|nr:hypothetical protein F4820DRAFT_470647 [Hypoxylon rubiginosum]